MTPKERAEKIFLMRHMFSDNRIGQEIIVQKIACEIEKAQEEAVQFSSMVAVDMVVALNKEFKAGFAAAKKQAAEIAKDWPGPGGIVECNSMEPVDVMDGLRKGLVTQIEKMDVKP